MAIVIHHGAPGSYKSFCLVQDVAIPALIEGRTVVTNIRSFTLDKVNQNYPDINLPPEAFVYHIDCDSSARNRLIMASFFHWLPFKACLIIDEGQRIYPNRRDFKLESLDTFISPDSFDVEYHFKTTDPDTGLPVTYSRPEDVKIAFDMHRHYQWDVYISTPNIAKIHKDIRESTEYAYYHKSLAGKIPFLFKNQWYEFQHDPESNGKSKSHIIGSPNRKTANLKAFQCYSSTITGEHTESKAGKPIFSDRSVRFKLYTILFMLLSSGFFISYRVFSSSDTQNNNDSTVNIPKNIINTVSMDNQSHHHTSSPPLPLPNRNNTGINSSTAFDYHLNSIATFDDVDFNKTTILIFKDDNLSTINASKLLQLGYRITLLKHCFASFQNPLGERIDLTCEPQLPVTCTTIVKTPKLHLSRDCSIFHLDSIVDNKETPGF